MTRATFRMKTSMNLTIPQMSSIYLNTNCRLRRKSKVWSLSIKELILDIDKASSNTQGGEENSEESVKSNFNNLMKNLRLTINKLHIRFEDDYF